VSVPAALTIKAAWFGDETTTPPLSQDYTIAEVHAWEVDDLQF
jgi:hypothetical protein